MKNFIDTVLRSIGAVFAASCILRIAGGNITIIEFIIATILVIAWNLLRRKK